MFIVAALVLLAVEVAIAVFVRGGFVRVYLGDVLAVMLVYSALRATGLGMWVACAAAFGIAVAIEAAQAFNLLAAVGLSDNHLARTILGGSFDLADIAAYAAGGAAAVAIEYVYARLGRGRST